VPLTPVAHRFPVSVKGVILTPAGEVVLLKNERDEWELPGGKLEPGEDPAACVEREVEEELGLHVRAASLLDCWLYEVRRGVEVLIVTYGCHAEPFTSLAHSAEHTAAGTFAPAALDALPMPDGYRRSIRDWLARVGGGES
jgi:mutator protein MutT